MTIATGSTALAADVLAAISASGIPASGNLVLAGNVTVNGVTQSTIANGSLYIGQSDFRRATLWSQGAHNQIVQFSRIGSVGTDVEQINSYYLVNHNGGPAGNVFNTKIVTSASNAPACGAWNFLAALSTSSAYPNRAAAGPATQTASYAQAVRTAVTGGAVGASIVAHVAEMHDFVDQPSSTRGAALTLELDWAGNNVDDDDSTGVVSIDLSLANTAGSDLLVGNGIGFYGNTHTAIKRVFDVNVGFTQAALDTRDATQKTGANAVWLATGHHIALSSDGAWAIASDGNGIQFLHNGGILGFWNIFSTLHAPGGLTSGGTVSGANVSTIGVVSGAYIQGSASQGVIALGTTQDTATILFAQWNNVTIVTSGSGAILPSVAVGTEIGVWNNGANALLIYPPAGATIDALATNTAYSIAAGASRRLVHIGAAKWYSS